MVQGTILEKSPRTVKISTAQILKGNGHMGTKGAIAIALIVNMQLLSKSYFQLGLAAQQLGRGGHVDIHHPGRKTVKTRQVNGERGLGLGKGAEEIMEVINFLGGKLKRGLEGDVGR